MLPWQFLQLSQVPRPPAEKPPWRLHLARHSVLSLLPRLLFVFAPFFG